MPDIGTKAPDFTLSYPDLAVITACDVFKPGKDGQPTRSLLRSTCLIDEAGVIVRALGGVKPKENASRMPEALA